MERCVPPFPIRAAAAALLVPVLAWAPCLQAASSPPTATRQSTTLDSAPPPKTAPMSSSLDDRPAPSSSAPQSTPVPSSLDDRPQSSTKSSKAKSTAAPASAAARADAATERRPVKLYDRGGRLIPGAVQVGPNRVLDTRSGRYHSTVPSGDGQRIDD
jgi:hypothetical protein